MADTQAAMTYPTEAQYERWKDNADQLGVSVSQYMRDMVEAGTKKFDLQTDPNQTREELRQQRNDLKDELEHARQRIEELEKSVHTTERDQLRRYVENNPGADATEIMNHLGEKVPARFGQHISALSGEAIRIEQTDDDDDQYYPLNEANQ